MRFRWDTEVVPCALCGSSERLPLLSRDRYSLSVQTVVCAICGLVYVSPRPDSHTLERFYSRYYRLFYEGAVAPDMSYVARSEDAVKAARRFDLFRNDITGANTVLDVGCGLGYFLRQVAEALPRTKTIGIEPDPQFAAFARALRGVEVREDLDSISPFTAHGVDIVTLFHVLEHAPDPRGLLQTVHRLLAPGGRLLVEVPDLFGSWRGVGMFHLAHLYYFEECTLLSLLRECGFRPRLVKGEAGTPCSIAVGAERLDSDQNEPAAVPSRRGQRGRMVYDEVQRRIELGPPPGWKARAKGWALATLGFENYGRLRRWLEVTVGATRSGDQPR